MFRMIFLNEFRHIFLNMFRFMMLNQIKMFIHMFLNTTEMKVGGINIFKVILVNTIKTKNCWVAL